MQSGCTSKHGKASAVVSFPAMRRVKTVSEISSGNAGVYCYPAFEATGVKKTTSLHGLYPRRYLLSVRSNYPLLFVGITHKTVG